MGPVRVANPGWLSWHWGSLSLRRPSTRAPLGSVASAVAATGGVAPGRALSPVSYLVPFRGVPEYHFTSIWCLYFTTAPVLVSVFYSGTRYRYYWNVIPVLRDFVPVEVAAFPLVIPPIGVVLALVFLGIETDIPYGSCG